MIQGKKAEYSYAFYGVDTNSNIYDLLSGKVVDTLISYKGHSNRDEILHNILGNKWSADKREKTFSNILSYKGFLYRDDVKLAKKAIVFYMQKKGLTLKPIKKSLLKHSLFAFIFFYIMLAFVLSFYI